MARKRKKRSGAGDDADKVAAPKPPPPIATQLGALLKQAGMTKPAVLRNVSHGPTTGKPASPRTMPPPSPEPAARVTARPPALQDELPTAPASARSASELRSLNDAYAGARPLAQKTQRIRAPVATPAAPLADDLARAGKRADDEDAIARARLSALVGGGVRFKVRSQDDFVEAVREGASPKLLSRVSGRGFSPEATLDLHGARAAEVAQRVSSFVRTHKRAGARYVLVITGKGLHSEGGVSALRQAAVEALTQGGAAPLVLVFATAHVEHGGTGALAVLLE